MSVPAPGPRPESTADNARRSALGRLRLHDGAVLDLGYLLDTTELAEEVCVGRGEGRGRILT